MFLALAFVTNESVTWAAIQADVGRQAAIYYFFCKYVFCREVCDKIMSNIQAELKIGGIGEIVEIDECYLC